MDYCCFTHEAPGLLRLTPHSVLHRPTALFASDSSVLLPFSAFAICVYYSGFQSSCQVLFRSKSILSELKMLGHTILHDGRKLALDEGHEVLEGIICDIITLGSDPL